LRRSRAPNCQLGEGRAIGRICLACSSTDHLQRIDYRRGARVHTGLPFCGWGPFEVLVSQLEAPFLLLYVLHTLRGEARAARYQGL
jgi:hypothetical protein